MQPPLALARAALARLAPSKMALARPTAATFAWLAVAILATAPAWIVKYPPLQDMPFHVAALRVIHDFHDPRFAFERDYVLNLSGTQYVLYYLVGSLLAYVLGVVKANAAMLCIYLGGTPLAIRALLRALGKDERLALFCLPMLVNTMFAYGFLPFLLGIPLLFLSIAEGVRHFAVPTLARGVRLGVLAVLVFYTNLFPFLVLGLALATIFPWERPRAWLHAAAPLAPAVLLLVWWTRFSEAGKASTTGFSSAFAALPLNQSIANLPAWLFDVFHDTTDEKYAVALGLLIVLALGLAQGDVEDASPLARRLTLVPIACAVAYFTTGENIGPVWLFAQRFPIFAALTAVPLLRIPGGVRGHAVTGLALAVGASSIVNTCKHFIAFQVDEVGDLEEAIDAIPEGSRVAALVYDRSSTTMNGSPFLHFGSYAQVAKGGFLQFSYADWGHWPFRYRPGHEPPPGGHTRPRWEWTPESVSVRGELYPFYDVVLTRGRGFSPPAGTYQPAFRGDRWTVWRRDGT